MKKSLGTVILAIAALAAVLMKIVTKSWVGPAIVLGMAALIGLIAAFVPAVIASRKNVVESLRFTG